MKDNEKIKEQVEEIGRLRLMLKRSLECLMTMEGTIHRLKDELKKLKETLK